jgi:predicted RNA-binding Zn-ribbon protein involved in translation (DUF1610 family)
MTPTLICPACGVNNLATKTHCLNCSAVLPSGPVEKGPQFHCPFCGSAKLPKRKSEISTKGWVICLVLLILCFPLCWLGLFIKEESKFCRDCNMRLA